MRLPISKNEEIAEARLKVVSLHNGIVQGLHDGVELSGSTDAFSSAGTTRTGVVFLGGVTIRHQRFDLAALFRVELPTSALRLLVDILSELSNGNAVRVVPVHAELTTQEAADLLDVSRPHLVKLLEEGLLPHHKNGKHRRVRFEHLMHFMSQRDRASEIAMEELAKQAQVLEMGYR